MAFNDISTFIDKIKMLESTDTIAEEPAEPATFIHPLVLAMRELQSEGIVESYHTDSLALTEIAEDNEIDEEIAYHGSIDDITAFHPLTHFGTEKSAKDRMIYKKYKDGKIYKVDLDIKNPLTIKDFSGIHYDRYYAFELRRLNLISQEEMEAITRIEDKADLRKALLDKLKELGIDGFVYKNRYEDKGNISYVIVDPNQVKVLSVEPVAEEITEARDILVEYSRAKTAEMVGDKILQALANDTPQWGPPRLVQIQKTVFEEPWQRQRPEVLQSWINEVLVAIEDADPTPNKVYTPWLARMYAKGDTKLEDLNRQDVLRIYDLGKKRRMIKPEHSDINRFKTYREFETMMFDNYEFDDIENIAKKEEEKGKAKKVYEDDNVTVIVPEDEAAACRYGRGARWCTAAVRGQNYFDQYNSQGNLYILIPKTPRYENEKYQLHFPTNQFMNESEIEVYLPEILSKRFPGLIPFFKKYEPKINDLLYFADVETITDIVGQIRELTLARAGEMVAAESNYLDNRERVKNFYNIAKSVLDQDPSTILSKYENMYDEDERRNVTVRWLPVILGSQMTKSGRGMEAGTALVWLGEWIRQLLVTKSGGHWAVHRLLRDMTKNTVVEASPNTLEGSFTPDLVESKTWLAKMLAKGLKGKNAGTIYVLGSWYGNMGIFLQQAGVKFDKLVLIEPNEKWLMHSKELLDTLNDEGKLVLIHQKAEDVVYEKPGVVINTSCNETGPVFLTKLPDNMLCLLQARNNVDDVLISTEDLQEFDELFPLGKTYYTGERELADPETDYTRYMKIGRAGKALSETASTGQGGGSAGSSGGQMVGGPTTYEQEYDMFKRKGPRRIIAMTNEAPTIAAALTKRPIKYIDIGGEELFEAAYDSMITSMKQKFPNQTNMITQQVNWAKQSLKKADRIVWYLRVVQAFISGNLGTDLLGDYKFQSLEQLQADITHFYGYQYAPIENYVFQKQKVSDVISDLGKLEDQWRKKQNTEKGVEPRRGDYKLLEFGGGYAWWFVNRAYCPDEGRSGSHCGNIAGKQNRKQRILSFRNANNQVLLTFILEPNGSLGEMKAKNNQKPSEKFHPYIVKLLDLSMITGIADGKGQYAPDANFNMFDLTEQQLNYFLQKKPALVETQVSSTPVQLLNAPDSIRNNSRLQQIAISQRPGLAKLFGDINTENWSQAVTDDPALIVYAPHDMPNFQEKLLIQLQWRTGQQLLGAPASISKNFNLLKTIISAGNPTAIGGVSPNLKGYTELCELAVSKNSSALEYVPEELRTEQIYLALVKNDGSALRVVPKELRTERMCFTAVSNNGSALGYVPKELRTERMCFTAVSKSGRALQYLPEEMKTEKICLGAVSKDGSALEYVPKELRTERMCFTAVNKNGSALGYVPKELRTERMCFTAVSKFGHALQFVPEELKTERMCFTAVSNAGYALKYVPEELKTERMCFTAVSNYGNALVFVPTKLKRTVRKMMRTNNT